MSTAAQPATRIAAIDVTRGVAVMGILLMNIVGFAWPEAAYINPAAGGGHSLADMATWAAGFVLIDSKMRGLFSMLFGASTLIVIDAAIAAGRDPWRVHRARMLTLALFGIVHVYGIWWGDILLLYAMAGAFLFRFRELPAYWLWRIGAAFIAVTTLALGVGLVAMRMAAAQGGDAARDYAAFAAGYAPSAPETLRAITIYRSDYASILHYRLIEQSLDPWVNSMQFVPETLGLMLIGMALFRSGLFTGAWDRTRLARWRNNCFAIAIPANLALLGWQFASGFDPWVVMTATELWSVPFDVLMAVGYAALIVGLAQRFADAPLTKRIGAAGRAAFSNYLGTSLVMTSLFYGYGLGLFAHVTRAPLLLFVAGMWLIMLIWSAPWLARFRYGPLEWLWRSMARGRWQPFRRE